MPKQQYVDSEIGEFTVTKKRNARKITLSISKTGVPNVTIPSFAPYQTGVTFLRSHREWVSDHSKPSLSLYIGSSYELYDGTIVQIQQSDSKNSTRRKIGQLTILRTNEDAGEKYALKAVQKHLARDSELSITPRVEKFASDLGVEPASVRYRSTTSRWGSCSSKRVLTFSVYTAQLPNELIDYIVIHELSHIHEMNHSQKFWDWVGTQDPDYKKHRKMLKDYELRPILKKV